jgi:hypothetical protein
MTATARPSGVPSSAGPARPEPVDPFILTLCRLAAPVTIRPPTAPQLKSFRFFTSRSAQSDGSEQLHLHMGYFPTLELAQKWAQLMRAKYPNATAMRAPAALLHKRDAVVPQVPPAMEEPPLTDTQVLRVLETRRFAPAEDTVEEQITAGISLLRPEDTHTRRVLKDAVAQRAPVSFAVQLGGSAEPFDVRRIPALSIFKAYMLYTTSGPREGRAWYSLRLGFFTDAISAKQVAYYVRSSFESVAVVPVTDDERTHARENSIDPAELTGTPPKDALAAHIDEVLDSDRRDVKPKPVAAVVPVKPAAKPRRKDSLDETLEMLAAREIWNDPDSLSETGVRHLKVEVGKRAK